MLPTTDSGNFTVNVKHPVGTALAVTDQTMRSVEKHLLSNPDVQTVFSAAGTSLSLRGSTTAQIGYQGSATVQLKDNRKHSTQDDIKIVQKDLGSIPGARIVVTPYDLVSQLLTGGAQNMEIDIFGQNYDQVMQQSQAAVAQLKSVAGLDGVDISIQENTPNFTGTSTESRQKNLGSASPPSPAP